MKQGTNRVAIDAHTAYDISTVVTAIRKDRRPAFQNYTHMVQVKIDGLWIDYSGLHTAEDAEAMVADEAAETRAAAEAFYSEHPEDLLRNSRSGRS